NAVVKKLQLYAPVSEEGKLVSSSAYETSPIKIAVASPDSLSETSMQYFYYDTTKREVVIHDQHYSLNNWVKTPYGVLLFTKNNDRNFTHKKFFFSLIQPKKVTQKLIGRLNISSVNKLSTVLSLKIQDEVPQRAQ